MLSATPDATFCRNIWSSFGVRTQSGSDGIKMQLTLIAETLVLIRSLPLSVLTLTNMKAKVYVTLKPSVLDPQGKAIKHSVELLGFNGISDIRQGKYFEIAIEGSRSADEVRVDTEKLAHDVLSNPIIEDFRVEIEQ